MCIKSILYYVPLRTLFCYFLTFIYFYKLMIFKIFNKIMYLINIWKTTYWSWVATINKICNYQPFLSIYLLHHKNTQNCLNLEIFGKTFTLTNRITFLIFHIEVFKCRKLIFFRPLSLAFFFRLEKKNL